MKKSVKSNKVSTEPKGIVNKPNTYVKGSDGFLKQNKKEKK